MGELTRFTHGGATLVAESFGSGPLVFVLIHGIGMGRGVFGDLIDHLRNADESGIRSTVIAVDLPGYGEAPEPARTLTMERTADLVGAFLGHRASGPAVVVGHSMGTQIAAELAARHPSLVGHLVLVAPTVDPTERTARLQLLRLAQDLFVESPRVIWIGAREYLRAGPNLRSKLRAMLTHRPETAYPRVSAPTLVLRGEHDYVSSRAWCRVVVESLPDGRMEEIEAHGHETMIRDAAPAAEAILAFVGAD